MWLVHNLCRKLECWLYIFTTTRANRVCNFFFITFNLSTELLEDKQRFKLGGVDTSPLYLLFQTILPLFWTLICMIWMELTRTDAIFSRICVFAVTLKSHTANIVSSQWNCTNLIAHLLTMCYSHDSNTSAVVLHVNLVPVLMWCDATSYLMALFHTVNVMPFITQEMLLLIICHCK